MRQCQKKQFGSVRSCLARFVCCAALALTCAQCYVSADCHDADLSCSGLPVLLYLYNQPVIYTGGTITVPGNFTQWQVRRFDPDGALVWQLLLFESASATGTLERIKAAPDGNLYVYGINSLTGGGDHYLVKVSSAGAILWTATWGQSFGESANALTVDANGNVYAVGTFNNGTNDDWWIKKFAPDGTEITTGWNKIFNGAANNSDTPKSVNVSVDGFVYVSGAIDDGLGVEGAIRKFQADGTEITTGWNKRFGTTIDCSACSLGSDAAGNLYLATNINTGNTAWYVRKFAPDGTEFGGGWPYRLDFNGGTDFLFSLAIGPQQEIVVSGWLDPTGTGTQTVGHFVRLDSDGRVSWTYEANGGTESDIYAGVDVDRFGRFYFAGLLSYLGAPAVYDQSLIRLDRNGRLDANSAWQGKGIDAGFGLSDYYIALDIP